jgi:hypothetical protein
VVDQAVTRWTNQLVDDRDYRNPLLHYRDLQRNTLDLRAGSDGAALRTLLTGEPVRLSTLFPDPAAHTDAVRRARAIQAKATEHIEERGLQTLFVVSGMATWQRPAGARAPMAPVLLRTAILKPQRPTAQNPVGRDFELSLIGDWEVSPVLRRALDRDYRIDLDAAGLEGPLDLTGVEGDDGARAALTRLQDFAAHVPDFRVRQRVVLSTFSYAKVAMVRDLEGAGEALAASDLIAAIAGDDEARVAVRSRQYGAAQVDLSVPDRASPADEFLVLDADASQQQVVNLVAAGADLVVEGPPGTGKSQTIANLISTLTARGQRVLFVAEKRAAIDAVLHRLEAAGVRELVLDLFDPPASRSQLVGSLGAALNDAGSTPPADLAEEHHALQRRRDRLVNWVKALHAPRPPWEVCLYDLQAALLGTLPTARSELRLPPAVLTALGGARFREVQEALEDYVDGKGVEIGACSPWAPALEHATITTSNQVQHAADLVRALQGSWTQVQALLQQVIADAGLTEPTTMAELADRLGLLGDVQHTTNRLFKPGIYQVAVNELITALQPATAATGLSRRLATMSRSFRQARTTAREHCLAEFLPDDRDLLAKLRLVADEQARWAETAMDGQLPRVVGGWDDTRAAWPAVFEKLQALNQLLGDGSVAAVSPQRLGELLDSLHADHESLQALPRLHPRRDLLRRAGLDAFLAELTHRQSSTTAAVACLEYVWKASIHDHLVMTDDLVGAFDGTTHDRVAEEFRELDQRHVELTRQRVRRAWAQRVVNVCNAFSPQRD